MAGDNTPTRQQEACLMAAIEDRKYQSDALDAVSAQWRQGKKRVVLVMPCGAGKGTVTAMCIRKAAANGKVSVVLVHRRNLVKQLAERMGEFGIRYSTVMSNLPKEPWVRHDPAPQCWICSKDTLLSQMPNGRWDERINADLCFTDECVTGDTVVTTEHGDVRIDAVGKLGCQWVLSHGPYGPRMRRIVRFMDKGEKPCLTIEVQGGKRIVCTSDHPIWTQRGWVSAGQVKTTDQILSTASAGAGDGLGVTGTASITSSCRYTPVPRGGDQSLKKRRQPIGSLAIAQDTVACTCGPNPSDESTRKSSTCCQMACGTSWQQVLRVSGMGPPRRVYDIEVEDDHNFYANGMLVHNCHRGEQDGYNKLLKACPAKYHLGLTATPVRPDGSGLGSNNWDALVVGATVKQLVSLGHLVPHRVYAPPGVCMRRRLGRPVRPSGNPIDEWVRHASGKRTIAFLPDVATARDMAAKFKDAGIPSAVLSAKSPDEERTAVLAKLKSGEILWLANVDLFTEGMDCPEIEVCQIVRKWDSLWAMMQGVGRAFRPAAHIGKTHAVILDHTGTTAKHGYPDIEPEWRLDETGEEFERRHRERVQKELGDPVDCRKCGAVFAGTPKCPYCGTPVPPSTKRKELVYEEEGLAPAGSVFAPVVSKEQKVWDRVRFSARYKGMSCGWAFMVFKTKTGKTPQQAGVRPLFTYDQREMPVGEAERVLSRR